MGLFGRRESREEREQREIQKYMDRYHLNDISDPNDLEAIREIAEYLQGTGLMETGMILSFSGSTEDRLQISYLGALMRQNWIIIRKLDDIASRVGSESDGT